MRPIGVREENTAKKILNNTNIDGARIKRLPDGLWTRAPRLQGLNRTGGQEEVISIKDDVRAVGDISQTDQKRAEKRNGDLNSARN